MVETKSNISDDVVRGFGDEWSRFDQSALSEDEIVRLFDNYFSIFPWEFIREDSTGFDLGCGSGRWARLVAPRVAKLNCIDASFDALTIAKNTLSPLNNCQFYHASVDSIPLDNASQDFGYSLGVLHHVPDTQAGIIDCARKLKPGAPFLMYCYYAFDNRPLWFRVIWKASDLLRNVVSRMPMSIRYYVSQVIALIVYWPLSRLASLLYKVGVDVSNFPLSYYRNRSFYVMRTDALDRFGTRLEKRFTRKQLKFMLEKAGFENIIFSDSEPYWCVLGYRMIDKE